MGEVSFSRRYYRKMSGEHVFLLDEEVKLGCGYGLYSENLAGQTVVECSDKPFRKAASSINSLTGQNISAMGAWSVAQFQQKQGKPSDAAGTRHKTPRASKRCDISKARGSGIKQLQFDNAADEKPQGGAGQKRAPTICKGTLLPQYYWA